MKKINANKWFIFPLKLSIAATGTDKSWKPKTERISQRYTANWKELVRVK